MSFPAIFLLASATGIVWAIVPLVAACASSDAPTIDTFKQVFIRSMMALKPMGMAERNVLFEDVKPVAQVNGRYTFQVSGSVRDYGTGYPPNKYWLIRKSSG